MKEPATKTSSYVKPSDHELFADAGKMDQADGQKANLAELDKLEDYLKKHNIEYERCDEDGEWLPEAECVIRECHQIAVPSYDRKKWDAICHRGSYGYSQGLLEIMGTIVRRGAKEKVEGWLTADDVIQRIEERYGKKGQSDG